MARELNPDLHSAYIELANAREGFEEAEGFYTGDIGDMPASRKVKRLFRKHGITSIADINLAHIVVDTLAAKMNINAVTTEDQTLSELLDDIRDENELDEELPVLFLEALKLGDAYLFCWPDTNESGDITGVRMRIKDAKTTRVFYDPEDHLRKAFAIQSWNEGEGNSFLIRANLYYADRIERYVHKGKVPKTAKNAKWEPFSEDGSDSVLTNPFDEVPFFHFRTTRTYGTPVHKPGYGVQIGINKLTTAHLATVDYQSFPQRYALVDPAADPSGAQNDFDEDHPDDADSDPESYSETQLDSSPSAVWNLQGYKEVGQFDPTDPDAFMKPLDRYTKMMAQVTNVPFHIFDSTGDAISGASRRAANESMYAQVESLHRSFGSTLKSAYEFALSIAGVEDVDVNVKWQPVRTIEDKEGLEALFMKERLGVPRSVLLQEAGYDSDLIDEWLQNPSSRAGDLDIEQTERDIQGEEESSETRSRRITEGDQQ